MESKQLLIDIGLYNDENLNKAIETDFNSLSGGQFYLPFITFEAYCIESFGYSNEQATAMFETLSKSYVGAMDKYDFMLFRLAITDFDSERDSRIAALVDIRRNTLFRLFDKNKDGILSLEEFRLLIRELACLPTHTDYILEKMKPPEVIKLELFKSMECLTLLESNGLRTRQLFQPKTRSRNPTSMKIVWDRRCVEANSSNTPVPPTQALQPVGGAGVFHPPPLAHLSSAPIPVSGVSTGFRFVDPAMLSSVQVGGLLVRDSDAYCIASTLLENCRSIANRTYSGPDIADHVWMVERPKELLKLLLGCDTTSECERRIAILAEECKHMVKIQAMCPFIEGPVKVFGDIHGQFRDLLLLFREYGFPSKRGDIETVKYVFNGDWVDRGAHQIETVVLLFALKVVFPSRVYLIRGNHEFRDQNLQNSTAGFHLSCSAYFAENGSLRWVSVMLCSSVVFIMP